MTKQKTKTTKIKKKVAPAKKKIESTGKSASTVKEKKSNVKKPAKQASATPEKKNVEKKSVGKSVSGKKASSPEKKLKKGSSKEVIQPENKQTQKSSGTVLSMAFQDVKPIAERPKIARSKSGNLLYEIEYVIRSSPAILFNFLTTPSGMAQWFADSVDFTESKCSFVWEGYEENATIIDSIEDEYVRYRWDNSEDDEYFEFRITKNEITGDTVLFVSDFAAEEDIEGQKRLWDSQIKLLIQQIGG